MENRDFAAYHRKLNNEAYLPVGCFQRNHYLYPLVCYINNIIALSVSENYGTIPIFVNRAFKNMEERHEACTDEKNARYCQLATEYLAVVSKFVFSLENVDASLKDLIPKKLLE